MPDGVFAREELTVLCMPNILVVITLVNSVSCGCETDDYCLATNVTSCLESLFYITLILIKVFFKFQKSEEKDGEASSDDIKTGDFLRSVIKVIPLK